VKFSDKVKYLGELLHGSLKDGSKDTQKQMKIIVQQTSSNVPLLIALW